MSQDDLRRQWETITSRTALQVNVGWLVQHWATATVGSGLVLALLTLALRLLYRETSSWYVALLALGMAASLAAAWWLARRHFETNDQARVRLEDALGLKTRLTAAVQGVGVWPALPAVGVHLPLTWRWQRPLGLLALAISFVAFALWIPLPQVTPAQVRTIEKPSAVQQVQAWIDHLRESDAVKPESLAEVEKKMEELLKRPADQWYEHASLEAAENLRDQTGNALQELGTQFEQARGNVMALAELGMNLPEEAKRGLAKQLGENMQGMRSGAMQASPSLMEQLRNLDPKTLGSMSKEQMQKLQERLQQNAKALCEALANAPEFQFKECEMCNGNRDTGGQGPGKPNRGRDNADLRLTKEETNLNTKRTEKMDATLDPERVAPGDLLGMQDGKHKVDETLRIQSDGGSIQSLGEGGAAVGKDNLLPTERDVLKRYFKE